MVVAAGLGAGSGKRVFNGAEFRFGKIKKKHTILERDGAGGCRHQDANNVDALNATEV